MIHRAQPVIDVTGRALYFLDVWGSNTPPSLLKISLVDGRITVIPLPPQWVPVSGGENDIYLVFDSVNRLVLIPNSFGMGQTTLSGLGVYAVDAGTWTWESVPQGVMGSAWGFDENLGALVGVGKREQPFAYYIYKYGPGGTILPPPPLPPPPPPSSPPSGTATLTANPATIMSGQSSVLTMFLPTLDYHNIFINSVRPSCVQIGTTYSCTLTVSPTTATTYQAMATNSAGTPYTMPSATVTVNNAAPLTPLTCTPAFQTVGINAKATFFASGGGSGYTWSAFGGTPSSGTGATFSNFYTTAGTYTMTTTSGTKTASCSVTVTAPPPSTDTQAPTIPQGLTGNALSSSQITLSWIASTDNIGVTVYKIFRNSSAIASAPSPSYTDSNLLPSTSYIYTVVAYDLAGNTSSQSGSISITTLSGNNPTVTPTPPTLPLLPSLPPDTISPTTLTCTPAFQTVRINAKATFFASGGGASYSWYAFGGNPSSGTGATFSNFYTTAGTYTVIISLLAEGSSQTTSCSVTVTAPSPTPSPIPIPTPIPPPIVGKATPSFTGQVLALGSRDPSVKNLQQFLITQGILAQGKDTGYFGLLTRSAVIIFQQRHAIPTTGVVGLLTAAKIDQLRGTVTPPTAPPTAFTQNLYIGLRNSDVTALQLFLIKRGLLGIGKSTGYFGLLTEAAVRTFQCQQNIVCSGNRYSTGWGVVGPKTRAVLNTLKGN